MVTPSYLQTSSKNDKQTQSTSMLLDDTGSTTLPGPSRSSAPASSSRHASQSPVASSFSLPRDLRPSGSNGERESPSPRRLVKALPRVRRTSSTSTSSDDTLSTSFSFLSSRTSSSSLSSTSSPRTPGSSNSSNSSTSPQPEPKQAPATAISQPKPSARTTSNRSARIVPPTLRWVVPPRVLLVDDDVVYRMLSEKLLQVFGCMIDIAVDGAAAVTKMNLEKYDLVFMDIMMPKLDGLSATSLIRQFDHFTPIISVTSNYHPDEVVAYYSSGMNDVLPKPFTRDGVHGILEKHLVHLKAIQNAAATTTTTPFPSPSSAPPCIITTPPPTPVPFSLPPLSQRLVSPVSAAETLQTLPIISAPASTPVSEPLLSVPALEGIPASVSVFSQSEEPSSSSRPRSPSPMIFATPRSPPTPLPSLPLASLRPLAPTPLPTHHARYAFLSSSPKLGKSQAQIQDEAMSEVMSTCSFGGLKRPRDGVNTGQPERKRSVKRPRSGEGLDLVGVRLTRDSRQRKDSGGSMGSTTSLSTS